jgi:hypothetical protein
MAGRRQKEAVRQTRFGCVQSQIQCKHFARSCHRGSSTLLDMKVYPGYIQVGRSPKPLSSSLMLPTHLPLFDLEPSL